MVRHIANRLVTLIGTAEVTGWGELAKSWPFGAAIIALVWLFLKHFKEQRSQHDSQFSTLTERCHDCQDRATEATNNSTRAIELLASSVAENTRVMDRVLVSDRISHRRPGD